MIGLRTKPSLPQQSDLKEHRDQDNISALLERSQPFQERIKNRRARIALSGDGGHQIDQACASRHQREIFPKIRERFFDIGLRNTIERVRMGFLEEIEVR